MKSGQEPRELPVVEAEEVGLSSKRLANIIPAMEKRIDTQEIPGAVTLVARHGKIAHFEAQGFMDIDKKVPMTRDTIFRIASMTKPITSVALLTLYEEGHFMLDDPISNFIPAFKDPMVIALDKFPGERMIRSRAGTIVTVPANREITFRDCLTHTAGFATSRGTPMELIRPYMEAIRVIPSILYALPPEIAGVPVTHTVAESVESLAKIPLNFQPGTEWAYNAGHDVAGVLVEVISGQSLDKFIKKRLLEPLGMNDTHFYLPEEKLTRFATLYNADETNGWQIRPAGRNEDSPQVKGPKVRFSGSQGLLSTATDYARFAQMLLNGGVLDDMRILGRKTVELMTTNHTGDLPICLMGPGYGFGLGVYVCTDPAAANLITSIGTYGWGGAYTTWYFADPKEDMIGLCFSQVLGFERLLYYTLGQEFTRHAYQALID